MVSRLFFLFLVVLLAVQRLLELRLSRRNERAMLARGGREHAPGQFRLMKVMHTAWFAAMLAEVFALRRPFLPGMAGPALVLAAAGQGLRYAAIRTLGERWCVRVVTVPGAPPVQSGIYRYLRHPNYVGVALEIAGVPLVHGAMLTSLVFTVLNAALLAARIRTEEGALEEACEYGRVFAGRPRFLPGRPE